MSVYRLPNFSALRAFEAAARHENFSRAAEELQLTHGAVSHQVRALERELGLALFVRNGKQVRITEGGAHYARQLARAFADMAAASEALRRTPVQQRLSIAATPLFAARWLAPRLGGFIERYPDIHVVLQSAEQWLAGRDAPVDIGIRFGVGQYPGWTVERLMAEVCYPVVSPHYRSGALPERPELLGQHTLLGSEEGWMRWLHSAGVTLAEPFTAPRTEALTQHLPEDGAALLRAAVAGQGVALVPHLTAQPDIAAGQLLRLFDTASPCHEGYFLLMPPAAAQPPQVSAFRDWLLDEVRLFQRQPD